MQVLLATAYMPSVGYMAEVIRAEEILIEAFETYTKQTCRNHCVIFGPNGRHTLSIPVIKPNGNRTLTRDVQVSTHQPWQKIHWRSMETAYNNSPFFLYYQDDIAPFYEKSYRFLADLNMEILHVLLRLLRTSRQARFTDNYQDSPAYCRDLRAKYGAKNDQHMTVYPHYTQVFESRHGFIPGLSILDLIFNLGPEAPFYLNTLN